MVPHERTNKSRRVPTKVSLKLGEKNNLELHLDDTPTTVNALGVEENHRRLGRNLKSKSYALPQNWLMNSELND